MMLLSCFYWLDTACQYATANLSPQDPPLTELIKKTEEILGKDNPVTRQIKDWKSTVEDELLDLILEETDSPIDRLWNDDRTPGGCASTWGSTITQLFKQLPPRKSHPIEANATICFHPDFMDGLQ